MGTEILYTLHETKKTQLGVFRRRILCVEQEGKVLRVTPCVRPECPDLGFQIVSAKDFETKQFKDRQDTVDLSNECLCDLVHRLKSENQTETDPSLSQKHFDEIARVTELEKYRLPFSRLLEEGR